MRLPPYFGPLKSANAASCGSLHYLRSLLLSRSLTSQINVQEKVISGHLDTLQSYHANVRTSIEGGRSEKWHRLSHKLWDLLGGVANNGPNGPSKIGALGYDQLFVFAALLQLGVLRGSRNNNNNNSGGGNSMSNTLSSTEEQDIRADVGPGVQTAYVMSLMMELGKLAGLSSLPCSVSLNSNVLCVCVLHIIMSYEMCQYHSIFLIPKTYLLQHSNQPSHTHTLPSI